MAKKSSSAPLSPSPQPSDDSTQDGGRFPVVGIGASAGGIEASRTLLQALPANTGMAFVLVLHLSPVHPSMLPEILARDASIPVSVVTDKCKIQPDHFYVIPSGADLDVEDGRLRLRPHRDVPGHPRTIDIFFRALAREYGHKAIGVILSGTSTDGTIGLQEIKAAGGITFAQDGTAQHDGMPRSAVAAGCVDYLLPPDGIALELGRIAHHPYVGPPVTAPEPALDLDPILDLLHRETGVDFHQYKPNTLQRRIARRMLLHRIDDVKRYAELLKSDSTEMNALYQDVLIGVTSFFRNPECFDALKERVFPQLAANRSRHDPIRIWVLGCSTGEEAYSIAIALAEYLETQSRQLPVQIFATDVNGAAIERARTGFYSGSITQDVTPQRLRRYFTESDGGYRINKSIRDICVFARHNLIAEPPFSRIDLVTCRNLLIYLDADMQQRVMPILHFALKPNGYMVLGASETVGSHRDRFELEDAKNKIYRKKGMPSRELVLPLPQAYALPEERSHRGEVRSSREASGALDVYKEADRILLSKYVPPSVLVNGDFDILQFRGNTGLFLTPAPGKASLNLLKMLREGLLVAVRGALYRAKKDEVPVREDGLRVRSNGGYHSVNVEVLPMKMGPSQSTTCFMVLFDESERGTHEHVETVEEVKTIAADGAEAEITRLKQELGATREYLQAVIEQQEAANEELQSANEEVQSANEEVQSANEELQSINEELETSKEELQSSNEELATVNEELHNRNMELGQSNNDLMNLLSSVQLAIVMLGPNLAIRRFTPYAEKLLSLIPADVGRPIKDLNLNVPIPNLEQHLEDVIDSVTVKEFDVRDNEGHWYSLRLRPYRTLENKIDGAVLVLVDIDALKRSQMLLRRHNELLNQAYESIVMWELDGKITYWNRAAVEAYGYTAEQAVGRTPQELLATQPPLETLREVLLRDHRWAGELTHTRRDGTLVRVESRISLVQESDDRNVVVETSRPVSS